MMSLDSAVLMTIKFVSITFLLSGIELWYLTTKKSFFRIWSYANLKSELESGLPLPSHWIKALFSDSNFQFLLFIHMASAFLLLFVSHWALILILLVTHLLICIRFRGTFNGGSDMMKFVILTGSLLFLVSEEKFTQVLGIYYICIHMILSYFKAGWSKLMNKEWRSGNALQEFLSRSLFLESRRLSEYLIENPKVSQFVSWSVLLFELGIIIIIFKPVLTPIYFGLAIAFHFCNYLFLGLNRFFWIWLCGWPALLYLKIF
jgi:hypothetical protein